MWEGGRAANSHALTVRLTHFTTFSRSHGDIRISHTNFLFFFACQRFVMYEGYPYYVPAKSRQKCWGRKKKCRSPPPAHQLFWDLRDFIGWQRTAPRISHSKLSSNVGSPGGGCPPSHGREIFQFWGSESCNLVHSLVRFLAYYLVRIWIKIIPYLA